MLPESSFIASLVAIRSIPFSRKSGIIILPNSTGASSLNLSIIFFAFIHSFFFIGFVVLTGITFKSDPLIKTVEVNILLGSVISRMAYFLPLLQLSPVREICSPSLLAPITQDLGQIIHVTLSGNTHSFTSRTAVFSFNILSK